jgi:hypothetical protein
LLPASRIVVQVATDFWRFHDDCTRASTPSRISDTPAYPSCTPCTPEYLYWSPPGSESTVSLHVSRTKRDSLRPLLEHERKGEGFELDLDERLRWQGHAARQLRLITRSTQPRETLHDPQRGHSHRGPREVEEIVDFIEIVTDDETIRIGFRLDRRDAARWEPTLSRMVQSLRFGPSGDAAGARVLISPRRSARR